MYLRDYPFKSADLLVVVNGIFKFMKQGVSWDWTKETLEDMLPILLRHLKENPVSPEDFRKIRLQLVKIFR
jgi:hypothetical protein